MRRSCDQGLGWQKRTRKRFLFAPDDLKVFPKLCCLVSFAGILLLSLGVSYGQTQESGSVAAARTPTKPQPSEAPDALLAEAKSFLQKGMLGEAERTVRRYLDTYASSAEAHYLLGYILFGEVQATAVREGHAENKVTEEKAKASLAEYTEGAKYSVPGAFDLKVVALDYVLLGDYVDADKWLTKSLELEPKDSEGWYYLGRAKYSENRFEEAINAFQQCLKLNPKSVKAEDNLGLAYAGLGRNEEAIAAYQSAIAWQADILNKNPGPFVDLASLLIDANRTEEAIPYLVQVVEIAPEEAKGHELLGRAYEHLNQLSKAQAELEKAVELNPQSAALHYLLGQVYRKEGLKEKAQVEFSRSSTLSTAHASPQHP